MLSHTQPAFVARVEAAPGTRLVGGFLSFESHPTTCTEAQRVLDELVRVNAGRPLAVAVVRPHQS